MRKVAILFLLPTILALSLSVTTSPAVLYPGSSGTLLLHISGNGEHVRLKVYDTPFSIEDEGTWIDVGDVVDASIYPLGISVPGDLKPGVYPIHVELLYDFGGNSYEEHEVVYLQISGKPPEIVPTKLPTCGQISEVKLKITNGGPALHSAMLFGPFFDQSFVYLGDIGPGEEKEIKAKILVPWSPYFLPLRLVSADGNYEYNIGIGCSGGSGITVSVVPKELNLGKNDVEIIVSNPADVPMGPVVVQVSSDSLLGGEVTKVLYLGAKDTRTIPVTIEGASEKVEILVNLMEGNNVLPFSFLLPVKTSPEIAVYLAGPPEPSPRGMKVSIGVANVGEVEVDNVVVALPGSYEGLEFVGDLSPGDYDTVTFTLPETNTISVNVTYRFQGEEKEVTKTITIPVREGSSGWLPIVVAILIAAGAYLLWRKRR